MLTILGYKWWTVNAVWNLSILYNLSRVATVNDCFKLFDGR